MELDRLREKLSALVDGEVHGAEVREALDALAADAPSRTALQEDWRTYQLVGDLLRSGEHAPAPAQSSARFLQNLQARLQQEPALVPELPMPAVTQRPVLVEAANDGVFRWKAVAGFASLAALVAVVWNVSTGGAGEQAAGQAQLAAATLAPAPAVALAPASRTVEQEVRVGGGEPQIMLRDARLDELMLAHKQAGGGGAVQMPAGFMRSATFAAPER